MRRWTRFWISIHPKPFAIETTFKHGYCQYKYIRTHGIGNYNRCHMGRWVAEAGSAVFDGSRKSFTLEGSQAVGSKTAYDKTRPRPVSMAAPSTLDDMVVHIGILYTETTEVALSRRRSWKVLWYITWLSQQTYNVIVDSDMGNWNKAFLVLHPASTGSQVIRCGITNAINGQDGGQQRVSSDNAIRSWRPLVGDILDNRRAVWLSLMWKAGLAIDSQPIL